MQLVLQQQPVEMTLTASASSAPVTTAAATVYMMSAADPVTRAAVAATPIDSTTAANVVIGTAIGIKAVATKAAALRYVL